MEEKLNDREMSWDQRIDQAIHTLQVPPLDDTEGSSRYRFFVLKNTLYDVLQQLEGEEKDYG